jgi:hypothetical protein
MPRRFQAETVSHLVRGPECLINAVGFYRSIQHHLVDRLLGDGVHERREANETFCHAESLDLAALEGGALSLLQPLYDPNPW